MEQRVFESRRIHSRQDRYVRICQSPPRGVRRKYPAASPYQSDAEFWGYKSETTLTLQDFYNTEGEDLLQNYYLTKASEGNEPIPDAITVNGQLTGTYSITASRASKTRLRFICASSLTMFSISVVSEWPACLP